ncbi:sensor histidine kinase [Pseudoduganella ginsengisoli]|nr:ATP-binding protein [Pseudoduganella ginsengisoli]
MPMDDWEVRRQLHQLQVRQLDLEIQNAALLELQQRSTDAGRPDLFSLPLMGYLLVDPAGRVIDCNGAAMDLLHSQQADLLGASLADKLCPGSRTALRAHIERVFSTPIKHQCELQGFSLQDRNRRVRLDSIADAQNQYCHIVIQDIGERCGMEAGVDPLLARMKKKEEQLRAFATHLLGMKEDERKRVAKEVHDELGQNLLALRLEVSMLAARDGMQDNSAFALNIIDTSMRSVRGIINSLRPYTLDLGLPAALEWQVRQFEQRMGISCHLQADLDDPGYRIDEQITLSVFRILQEALANVYQHAHANAVQVRLRLRAKELYLSVSDNGVGLKAAGWRPRTAFGVLGMRERVRQLGGRMRLCSGKQGEGTTLAVTIPLS